MIRRWVAIAILVVVVGACAPFSANGKLSFSNARLSPSSFTCPPGAQNFGYQIKGSVDANNQTSKKIQIRSMGTTVTILKLVGNNWSAQAGDTTSAVGIAFSPNTVDTGAKKTLNFTTPWTCSDAGNNTVETYADFKVVLTMITDGGTYNVDLPNHRMVMS